MIEFIPYLDSDQAPAIFVNGVGGIYKIGTNSLQVDFVMRLRNAAGDWQASRVISLIWEETAWLQAGQLFRFAMEEYRRGVPLNDGRRKPSRLGAN